MRACVPQGQNILALRHTWPDSSGAWVCSEIMKYPACRGAPAPDMPAAEADAPAVEVRREIVDRWTPAGVSSDPLSFSSPRCPTPIS